MIGTLAEPTHATIAEPEAAEAEMATDHDAEMTAEAEMAAEEEMAAEAADTELAS